jgi:glycosyltransferase involved in cell wall biosynthesis
MPENPFVSIVTPSYNQAQFLEYTIQSVLAQDYKHLEYMIVDGGSTDGSVEIIQRYADRLAWWVSESDSGQAEAINKGLRRAKGEIVAWLNSDDIYLPGAILQAVRAFQTEPALGMIFGDAITIDAQGKPLSRLSFGDWDLLDLISFRIICQPAVFMRREVLEKSGYLESSYHFMLDHRLWIQMARRAPIRYAGGGIHKTDEYQNAAQEQSSLWAAARHHAGAKNVSQAPGFARETMQVLEWEEGESDLAAIISKNRNRVLAGAYRLNARYLLDGGLPGPALASYWRALLARPSYALKHWHRMAYALLCLIKLDDLVGPFRARLSTNKRKRLAAELRALKFRSERQYSTNSSERLDDWPGICLDI